MYHGTSLALCSPDTGISRRVTVKRLVRLFVPLAALSAVWVVAGAPDYFNFLFH